VIVRIDQERCEGHAICFMVAPELFSVDDEGRGVALGVTVTSELREVAMAALRRCPEQAVVLEEEAIGEKDGSIRS
jgi:ferredoxin